ncbi:MAG: Fic family protein [Myxococcota bacterium]|jgi:Fic family protein|nr:Fic family protein [Myxococcota bacterium]
MAADFYSIQEQMGKLRAELERRDPGVERALDQVLDVSLIFHDAALEGDCLDADEILAAIQGQPPVAGSTEQVSRRIRTLEAGLELMRREARPHSADEALLLLKRVHLTVTPDPSRGGRYRRSAVSHRAYFHEVVKPSRISYLLRRLFSWVDSEDARRLHPIRVAGEILYRLVTTSPFEDCSGQVARLFASGHLMAHGYLPAIVHAQDRQRYYEAFVSSEPDEITELLALSLDNSIRSSFRFLEQRQYAAPLRSLGGVA